MSTSPLELSASEARGLALAAALGGQAHPDSASVLRQLGLLQLDPLARVEKAHRLTCLARMQPDAAAGDLDVRLWSPRMATAFESWVHAVCLVPIEDWPLLRLARERALASTRRPPQRVLDEVRAMVAAQPAGATVSDIEQSGLAARGWDWSERKHATEHMLRTGELICSDRRGAKRVFDLPERRVAPLLLQVCLTREEIHAAMAAKALTAMGVATARDVSVYYNLAPADARQGLEAAGARLAAVEGWNAPAWMSADDRPPAAVHEPVTIGPFDNLIWDRDRTRRLFGFDYFFEAYKPQAKRRYGYYVLAVLDDGRFTGRADVRRDADGLTVLAAYPEPSSSTARFKASLDHALNRLQRQLYSATQQSAGSSDRSRLR